MKKINYLNNLVSKMKKTVFVAVSVGITLSLVGCGGSSDSSSTATNGSTTFHVINTDPYAYAHVKIVGDDGAQIYASDFNCAANTTCEFSAPMNQTGRILFYDSKGAVINGYIVALDPGRFIYVKTSTQMLGQFVMRELLKRYPESTITLMNKLELFFENYNSPDNQQGRTEELGMYYQFRVVSSGIKVDDFYSALHARLENGNALEANLNMKNYSVATSNSTLSSLKSSSKVNNTYASLADSSSALCSNTAYDAMKVGSAVIGVFLPFGGDLLGGLADIANNACDQTAAQLDSIGKKLAAMDNKLNTVIDSLKDVNRKLDYLIGFEQNDILAKVRENYNTLNNTHVSAYKTLLSGTKYNSIKGYIESHGGLAAAAEKSQNLKDVLDLDKQKSLLQEIGSTLYKSNLITALNAQCLTIQGRDKDVVALKNTCNKTIVYYKTLVGTSSLMYLNIFKDVLDTVEYYRVNGSNADKDYITSNLSIPGGDASKSWSDQYKTIFQEPLNNTVAGLNDFVTGSNFNPLSNADDKSYFALYSNLESSLLNSLVKVECAYTTDSGKSVPNIYKFINDGDDSFIRVSCKNKNFNGNSVYYNSQYHFKTNGNNVANVMGVLTPIGQRRTVAFGWDKTFGRPTDSYYIDYATFDSLSLLWPLGSIEVATPDHGNGVWKNVPALKSGDYSVIRNSSDISKTGAANYFRYTSSLPAGEPLSYIFSQWIPSGGNNPEYFCLSTDCSVANPIEETWGSSGISYKNFTNPSGPEMYLIHSFEGENLAFVIVEEGKKKSYVPANW